MKDASSKMAAAQHGLFPALQAIVSDALSKGVGQTLITNRQLRDRIGVGAGTLQRALDLLQERGALETTARGHMGRRIDSIGVGECWQAAGLSPVRVVLSPGGPVEMDVLEQVLSSELTNLGVPHLVRHLRGGNQRLSEVFSGAADLTVTSAGTYSGVISGEVADGPFVDEGAELTAASRVLAEGTYYASDRLVVVKRPGQKVNRVCIDWQSLDHKALTLAQFPEGSGYVYDAVPFPSVPAYVLAGGADAGIWHITESAIPPVLAGLDLCQLSSGRASEVRDSLSSATVVGSPLRPEMQAIVGALQFGSLFALQEQALLAESVQNEALMQLAKKK